jgi:hypothetical protein
MKPGPSAGLLLSAWLADNEKARAQAGFVLLDRIVQTVFNPTEARPESQRVMARPAPGRRYLP